MNEDDEPQERVRHRVSTDVVVEKGNRIVLVKRGTTPFNGTWVLPGGHVEEREQIRDSAKREAKEEAGIDVDIQDILGIYDEPGRDPRGPVITVVYVCSTDDEELEAATDAAEARWFSLEELPEEMGFDHREILDDYLRYRQEI